MTTRTPYYPVTSKKRKGAIRSSARYPMKRAPVGSYHYARPGTTQTFKCTRFVRGSGNLSIASDTLVQGAGESLGAIYFQLADVPGYTEFTALFDQYRITKVVMKMMPQTREWVNQQDPAAFRVTGFLATILDFDDSVAPASIAAMQQYDNFKYQNVACGEDHVRVVYPRTDSSALVAAGTYTGSTNAGGSWIDCGTPTTVQFGIKYGLSAYLISTMVQRYDIMFQYWLEFKHLR